MDFTLSKEHEMLRKMYREFAENEVKPLATEIDEEERFPMETVEKMAKLGMMGIYFPKEYGGAGGDVLSYAMCVEELAKVCGTTAVIVSAHTSLCCAPIFEHGTEEQKRKYLPDLNGRATDKIADLIIDCMERDKHDAISEHIARQNQIDGAVDSEDTVCAQSL